VSIRNSSTSSQASSRPQTSARWTAELEITAISIHAYPHVADKYALDELAAHRMGDKYGPMIGGAAARCASM
jgi:predicted solute-binding protein